MPLICIAGPCVASYRREFDDTEQKGPCRSRALGREKFCWGDLCP